jgi:hypothetical protein
MPHRPAMAGFIRDYESKIMTDLIYIGAMVLFFVVSGLYVSLCEKM